MYDGEGIHLQNLEYACNILNINEQTARRYIKILSRNLPEG